MTRYFTRSGRDPLTLAPFEVKEVLGRELRMPTAWSLSACQKAAEAAGDMTASEWLVARARHSAEAIRLTGWAASDEAIVETGDEYAWIMARAMGWIDEEGPVVNAVVNLAPFCEPVTGRFELAGLRQAVRVLTTLAAAEAARKGQPHDFTCGWTNMGGLLMAAGIPYDSTRALGIAGCIAAMALGEASIQASHLAGLNPVPDNEELGRSVLPGLENARQRVFELPPTRQDSAAQSEPDRWRLEAAGSLDSALTAVREKGILTPVPIAASASPRAEEWLSPLSTLAEAVPSLQLPDVGLRLEIRSATRAVGLGEEQKESLLEALRSGQELSSLDIPSDKTGSLRTALGSWSFHPNAQISMASAVAPFVAGPLVHRVLLPSGVPAGFRASLKDYASSLALPGLTFVEEGSPEPEVLPLAQPPASLELEEASTSGPVVEEETLVVEPQAEEEPAADPEPDQAEEELAAQNEEEAAAIQQEWAAPLVETEPLVEPVAEADPESSSKPAAEEEPKTEEGTTVTDEPETEPLVEEEPQAAEEIPGEPEFVTAPAEPTDDLTPLLEEEPEAEDSEEPSGFEAIQEDERTLAELLSQPDDLPAELVEGKAAVAMAAPSRQPETVEEDLASAEPEAQVWEAPAAPRAKVVESKSVRTTSGIVVHLLPGEEEGSAEILVSALHLPAGERALLDSFASSLSLGLSKGLKIEDYLARVTGPEHAVQVMEAVQAAWPLLGEVSHESPGRYIKGLGHVRGEDPWRRGGGMPGDRRLYSD